MNSAKPTDPASNWIENVTAVNATLVAFSVAGLLIVGWAWNWAGVAMLWSFAAAGMGFVTGFIFGFPRVVTQGTAKNSANSPSMDGSSDAPRTAHISRLSVNTNLEQVSDWITKTLVGVGLVELKRIPGQFFKLASFVGSAIGAPRIGSDSASAAAALIAYFLVLGFLSGYLITRLFFQGAFDNSDRSLLRDERIIEALPVSKSLDSLSSAGNMAAFNDPTVIAAAKRIKDVPPAEAAAQGISSIVVAKANLVAGSTSQAVNAYRIAVAKNPFDPQLRFEYASALRSAGADPIETIAALRDARSIESQEPAPDLRRKIYESLTYLFLYQPEPQGFTQAIFYGEEYTADTQNLPSATVWVNLAAAYGQQARWLTGHGTLDPQVEEKCFEAIEKAIALDPGTSPFLASLLAPNAAQRKNREDDLSVFETKQRFRDLLGLSG